MSTWLILIPFLVAMGFVLIHTLRRVRCPDCGDTLPVFCSPFGKTRRMWRAGGFLCARCGCETDAAGRKVTADMPLPPFPAGQWALVGVLLLVGVCLGTAVWVTGVPAAVAPPIVAIPQPLPQTD